MHDRPSVYLEDGFRGWRAVAQSTTESDGVVVSAPTARGCPCLLEGVQDITIGQLVPEPDIEAFDETVLPG